MQSFIYFALNLIENDFPILFASSFNSTTGLKECQKNWKFGQIYLCIHYYKGKFFLKQMNDTDKQNHYLLMPKIVLFHNLTCETPSTGTDCCYTVILFEFEYVDLIHLLLLPFKNFHIVNVWNWISCFRNFWLGRQHLFMSCRIIVCIISSTTCPRDVRPR